MAYKKILTVQDISCVGQCSMTVALPVLSACGQETCILPTAVLSNHTGGFECDLSFGERSYRVDVPELSGGEANVSFGELTVDLRSIGSVSDDCHIEANCSFGALNLLVPPRFAVRSDNSTAFASVNFIGHPDSDPEGLIHLDANASFGEIVVRYT